MGFSEGSEASDRAAATAAGVPVNPPDDAGQAVTPVKIVVSGSFGVGKTTFVAAVSEIEPLTTEEVMTAASVGVDDLSSTPEKTTTTVAMDFGRISLDDGLVLYLFGTPGQYRFWFMWDDLAEGAIGAVILLDTRRLLDSFPVIDYFERTTVPFVIGINGFNGEFPYTEPQVREALDLGDDIPVVRCDARDPASATATLVAAVRHALRREGDGLPDAASTALPTPEEHR